MYFDLTQAERYMYCTLRLHNEWPPGILAKAISKLHNYTLGLIY